APVGAVAPSLARDDPLALAGLVAPEEADLADALLVAVSDAELHGGLAEEGRDPSREPRPVNVSRLRGKTPCRPLDGVARGAKNTHRLLRSGAAGSGRDVRVVQLRGVAP